MAYLWKRSWPVWLLAGLLLGLIISGLWPRQPLHAVATDRAETFAIATGPVDEEVEAVYFLDFLTGTLRAGVLSNQGQGFQSLYQTNVTTDLRAFIELRNAEIRARNAALIRKGLPPQPEVEWPTSPNYLMVTGIADVRRGATARMRPALSTVYVAETNTGIVMAYVMPWDSSAYSANRPSGGPLVRRAIGQFTVPLVQTQ